MRLVSLMADNMDFFYRLLADWLSRYAGVAIEVEDRVPWRERERMLQRGEAQIGFICGLPYVQEADGAAPRVELLAAPVMSHPRYRGKAIYFSDVVVRADSPFQRFADLRGASWAFNEPNSHSGYALTRYHLATLGERSGFFARVIESGAHQDSLRLIVNRSVDASAIDSMVLERELKLRPRLARVIRVIHTLGPSPAPPAVVSTKVPLQMRRKLRRALRAMHLDTRGRALLARAEMKRFARVTDADYDAIRYMARVAVDVQLNGSARRRPTEANCSCATVSFTG